MSSLRLATPDDAARIAEIHRRARIQAMPWLPIVHTPEEDFDYFSNTVLRSQTVRVAIQNNTVVGFSAFAEGWLNHLYVHPRFWKSGYGKLLLHSAQEDNRSLQLWTFQKNHTAREFYRRFGFTEVEKTDGQENEEKTPDVRMTWERDR